MRIPTVRVRFEDVGREHKSWEDDIATYEPGVPDADALERSVRKARALASRDILCTHNSDNLSGSVLAGFRLVGTWAALERSAQ